MSTTRSGQKVNLGDFVQVYKNTHLPEEIKGKLGIVREVSGEFVLVETVDQTFKYSLYPSEFKIVEFGRDEDVYY